MLTRVEWLIWKSKKLGHTSNWFKKKTGQRWEHSYVLWASWALPRSCEFSVVPACHHVSIGLFPSVVVPWCQLFPLFMFLLQFNGFYYLLSLAFFEVKLINCERCSPKLLWVTEIINLCPKQKQFNTNQRENLVELWFLSFGRTSWFNLSIAHPLVMECRNSVFQ